MAAAGAPQVWKEAFPDQRADGLSEPPSFDHAHDLADVGGRDELPVHPVDEEHPIRLPGRLPDLRHDVPHVHFHHVDVARPLGAVAHEFRRERPEGLQFQQARPDALPAQRMHKVQALRAALP